MTAAATLENFAAAPSAAQVKYSAEQMKAEYERGVADGIQQAQERESAALSEALHGATQALLEQHDIRKAAIRETLAACAPVIQAITQHLAGDSAQHISDLLIEELQRLSHAGVDATCRICASVEMIERLDKKIAELGLSDIVLIPADRTQIAFEGGRITVDPDAFIRRIDAIIAELSPSEES